jgi:hypothetical protein
LARAVKARGWTGRLAQERAVELWPQVAGSELAQHTVALGVQSGILVVAVRDGNWATQLTFFRTDLLAKLRTAGVSGVRDIRFRVGFPSGLVHRTYRRDGVSATAVATETDWAEARNLMDERVPEPLSSQLGRLYVAAAIRRRRLTGMMPGKGEPDGQR